MHGASATAAGAAAVPHQGLSQASLIESDSRLPIQYIPIVSLE
eukprot:COSAG02_NODE_524_length_20723_cov_79.399438_14_plen_43_part_00